MSRYFGTERAALVYYMVVYVMAHADWTPGAIPVNICLESEMLSYAILKQYIILNFDSLALLIALI